MTHPTVRDIPWPSRTSSRRRRGGFRLLGPGLLAAATLAGAPSRTAWAEPQSTPRPDAGREGWSGSGWFERGMELHGDRSWDEAIAAFRQAIEKGHREEVASFNIACALARKGEKEGAFEWLEKAMTAGFDVYGHLDDSDLEALHADPRWTVLKGKARAARAGRDEAKKRRAAERLDLLLARAPRDGRALYDVGRELLRYRDHDGAARAFVAAAEAGVHEGTSLYNAACARALSNRRDEALDLLQKALDAGYDDPDHLREDDDLDGLRDDPRFRRLLKDADDLTLDGFPSLGARLLRSQKVAEALEAATRIEAYLKRRPDSGRGWSNLGFVSLAAGNEEQALRAYRRALDLGYRKPATMYNLACAHARRKERDEAFTWLHRAIDAGFTSWRRMEEDDDLFHLRRDARFDKAVARTRRGTGSADEEP